MEKTWNMVILNHTQRYNEKDFSNHQSCRISSFGIDFENRHHQSDLEKSCHSTICKVATVNIWQTKGCLLIRYPLPFPHHTWLPDRDRPKGSASVGWRCLRTAGWDRRWVWRPFCACPRPNLWDRWSPPAKCGSTNCKSAAGSPTSDERSLTEREMFPVIDKDITLTIVQT